MSRSATQEKTNRHLGKREACFHRESLRTSATRTPPPRHAREPPRTERIVTLSPDITTNTRTRLTLAWSGRRRLRRAPRPRPRALTSARSHSHYPRSGAPRHRAARRRRGRYPQQLRAVPIPRRGCHSGTKPVCRETPACGHARASHDTAARVHVRLQTIAKTRGVRGRLMHYTVSAFREFPPKSSQSGGRI